MLLEDFDSLEDVFAAETADAEALEPHSLAKAKHRPEWPLWEKAIEEELTTLKTAGTWRLEEAPPGAKHYWLKMGFQGEKGCHRQHCALQGTACGPRVQSDRGSRL